MPASPRRFLFMMSTLWVFRKNYIHCPFDDILYWSLLFFSPFLFFFFLFAVLAIPRPHSVEWFSWACTSAESFASLLEVQKNNNKTKQKSRSSISVTSFSLCLLLLACLLACFASSSYFLSYCFFLLLLRGRICVDVVCNIGSNLRCEHRCCLSHKVISCYT